jgi:hypothetical protein
MAMPMTIMPSVDPGWETDSGVGVGVNCCWPPLAGARISKFAAEVAAAPTSACAAPLVAGENASVKARPLAIMSTRHKIWNSALFMLAVSITWASQPNRTLYVYFSAFCSIMPADVAAGRGTTAWHCDHSDINPTQEHS